MDTAVGGGGQESAVGMWKWDIQRLRHVTVATVIWSPSLRWRVNSARHLLFSVENKQKQILRSARDDRCGGLSSLLGGRRPMLILGMTPRGASRKKRSRHD